MRVRPAVIVVLLLAAGCTRTKASEVTVASQSASTADVTTAGRAAPVGGGSTPAGTTQPNASTPQTTKPASTAPPTATSQPITQPTSTQPITSQPATSQPTSAQPTSAQPITQPASTQPATDRAQAVPVSPPPAPIVWRKCTGNRTECATLVVPLDYRHPTDGQTISLKLKRRLATGTSIGPLLVNPGGPGVGGTVMVDGAEGYFDAALLEKFDITAWDPRGTGASDGIVCLDDVDQFLALDPTPDDAAERQAIVDADALFANGCKTRSGRVLPFVSTEDSARDIDQIRQALGVAQIS